MLKLPSVEHKQPKTPTKTDLERKFVMRVDVDGRVMRAVFAKLNVYHN